MENIQLKTLSGDEVNLQDYAGKTLLIVNTASKCGFTGQYEGLQKLHENYKDQGLVVMGFPCNQFGAQEPGDEEQIGQFCTTHFSVSFPMFAKVEVNGDGTHPLFQWLKSKAPGLLGVEKIKWNFTKFLVSPDGGKVTRYAPMTKPESLEKDIKALLN